MKHRITVRGDGLELRGYTTQHPGPLSEALKDHGMVIASPMTDNEPISDPSFDASLEHVRDIAQTSPDMDTFIFAVAQLHFMQAMVIRGERNGREIAEQKLADRK